MQARGARWDEGYGTGPMACPGHAGSEGGRVQLRAWLCAAEANCAQFAGQCQELPALPASAGRSPLVFARSRLDDVMRLLPPGLQPSFSTFSTLQRVMKSEIPRKRPEN